MCSLVFHGVDRIRVCSAAVYGFEYMYVLFVLYIGYSRVIQYGKFVGDMTLCDDNMTYTSY